MEREIKAVFAIWNKNYKTTHTFSVQLGLLEEDDLTMEIVKEFEKCKQKHRLEILFDDSDESHYHLEKYVSPFEIPSYNEDYQDINNMLLEINYYSKKHNNLFEKFKKENLSYDELIEKMFS